ncbi:AAA family ATPase [bacterium]|nr:AAA family ATPase [bacterium]
MLTFGAFSLDEESGQLWRGGLERPLRAKSFAVLHRLVLRRGRLVTKEELFRACWPDAAVSRTVLRVCIAEIRAALAEDGDASVLVESVGRRGYRLTAHPGGSESPPAALVGRAGELAALRRALRRADGGVRQVVLVTGEGGMGKTTLLEHFAEEVRAGTRARVAGGQCVELTAGSQPYLPVLDLLAQLCADDATDAVRTALAQRAPSWLLQMPALIDSRTAESLRARVPSPNRDRMLRELGDAIDAIAAEGTVVLVVEDLHWSDPSSMDALAYLAQRTMPARLLLLASYRRADLLQDEALRGSVQSLVARRRAVELPLPPLSPSQVEEYLARRLAGAALDATLVSEVQARAGGNPLFVAATVDVLLERGILVAVDGRWRLGEPLAGIIPDSLRQLALRQIERLSATARRVLDAASVAGGEFAVAAVAAASGLPVAEVEAACAALSASGELVVPTGVAAWPDGTISGLYAFRHALYREVLDAALPAAGRARHHRAIAERLETAYGGRAAEIAAELASHFSAAGDPERSVRYHRAAADGARARFADREVVVHLRAALAQLPRLPASTERTHTELECLLALGGALVAMRGGGSAEALAVHRRALELADALDQPLARIQASGACFTFLIMRADLDAARAVAADMLATAARMPMPFLTFIGHVSLGSALFNLGQMAAARRELEEARSLWQADFPTLLLDPTIICRSMLAFTALVQGEPGYGAASLAATLAHARALASPYGVSYASELAAQYHATAGQRAEALEYASAAAPLAGEHGFVVHGAVAQLVRGWAEGDPGALRDGIAAYEGAGQYVGTSLFRALLVEVLLAERRARAALDELDAIFAFVERSGERRHLAELHRLRGESLRLIGQADAAGACFGEALSIARASGARLWELRAALSLARLRASDGGRAEARQLLDAAVRSFPADCALPDLRQALALRAEL